MIVACVREPVERICPTLEDRQLVITEIRGPQEGSDSYGQWIEVYNPSDQPIVLSGLVFRMLTAGRTEERRFMVRDGDLELAPGDYAVFADDAGDAKRFLDYSYTKEVLEELDDDGEIRRKNIDPIHPSGIIEIFSCDQLVDQVFYVAKPLPSTGTLILDGGQDPSKIDNLKIDNGCWCNDIDPSPDAENPAGIGIRGTPGAPNRVCGDEGTSLLEGVPSQCM